MYDVAPMIHLFYYTSSKEQNVVQKGARSVLWASSSLKKTSTLQRLTILYHTLEVISFMMVPSRHVILWGNFPDEMENSG